MNRITLIIMLVLGFVSINGLFSQVNEFTHPSILSFEKSVEPVLADPGSVVSVSGKHFKHGKQSLLWQWENTEASWRIKQPGSYTPANPHNDN